MTKWYIPEAIYTSQSWPWIVPPQETQMAGVQIRLVKRLQTKLQKTNCTILKYKNEIIFVPSVIFIGSFLRPRCFRKEHGILNILSRENRRYMQISIFPKFRP